MEQNNNSNWMKDLNVNNSINGDYSLQNSNLLNNNQQQQQTPTFDVKNGNLLNNLLEEENDYQKNGKTRSRIPRGTLDILLKEFQINSSPNSSDRKRIAAQCNIEEKRVRIWFQNKRAKLKKLQNSIQNNNENFGNENYNTLQQQNQAGNTYDPNYGIFEDKFEIEPLFDNVPWGLNHNYHFIDSSSVSVGGWKRLKNGHLSNEDENGVEIDNSHVMELVTNLSNLSPRSIDSIMGDATDLLLIISKKNNEINYFFSAIADDRRILFRVFFPIYTVVNCSISVSKERPDTGMESDNNNNNNNKNLNTPDKSDSKKNYGNEAKDEEDEDEDDENEEELSQLSLMLNKPPKFAVYFTDGDENDDNQWNICDDFSEDKQVSMSFMGSYEIPHIITGLEDSLKKMNSLILEYNSKFGGIYHVPPQQQQQQQQIDFSTSENTMLGSKQSNDPNMQLSESVLKKSLTNPFANSDFGFSPTPSNGVNFFQIPTSPNFLSGNNNNTNNNNPSNNNNNYKLPYMENPLINNSINTNINNRVSSNNGTSLLNEHTVPNTMDNQQMQNMNTRNSNSGLLNINDSLIDDDDEMKNDLYINSMLDLN